MLTAQAAPPAQRVRVLAVIPSLAGGGSERVLTTLLRHLDRRRFEPVLAVVDGRAQDLAADLPADLPQVDLGVRRVRKAAPALLRLIRAQRPRVVISTLGHLNLMIGLMKPLLPSGVKVVARESSIVSRLLEREPHPWAWRIGYRLFYRRLDLVICQSRDMQRDLHDRFGLREADSLVIPNPVDLARIRGLAALELPPEHVAAAPAVRLVAVGRLSPEKGFDVLLRALARSGRPDVQLDLLGQGPEEARLRALSSELALQDRVRFRGFQSNPYAWMRRADALVLSSRFEGLPNAVLEALACGTPVISTPVPSALEILAPVPEAVVAQGFDEASLSSALLAWMAGPRKRVPPERAASYGADAITRRYEEALLDVAGL